MNHIGQFEKILTDSGFITLSRLNDHELADLVVKYLTLQTESDTVSLAMGSPIGSFTNASTPLGIGFSILVVGLAAFNLLLNFDTIEKRVELRAAKYMEWYSAFGLLVTIVWLYLEIHRLLSKLKD